MNKFLFCLSIILCILMYVYFSFFLVSIPERCCTSAFSPLEILNNMLPFSIILPLYLFYKSFTMERRDKNDHNK